MNCRRIGAASLWLLAVLSLLLANGSASAIRFSCDIEHASIVAEDPQDATLACEGTRAALDFLEAQGLDVDTDIRIDIVSLLTEEDTCTAAGYFLASSNKVLILSYSEFLKFETWLRVPITHALYRALVAHEVAHVIALHNFRVAKPTIQAQEYLAYVTSLATLEPAQRERVLSQFPGDGYETDQQMNTTIYLCDPMRFGVEAYRHFLKKGRDADYFRRILSGRVLAD